MSPRFPWTPEESGDISEKEGYYPESYALAATSDGYGLSFGLSAFVEPSTRNGRRFARVAEGHHLIDVEKVDGEETVVVVSRQRRTLLCAADEVSYLGGPGRGIRLMKLGPDDALIGLRTVRSDSQAVLVKTSLGGQQRISKSRYAVTARGGKGREVMKRGTLTEIVRAAPVAPALKEEA